MLSLEATGVLQTVLSNSKEVADESDRQVADLIGGVVKPSTLHRLRTSPNARWRPAFAARVVRYCAETLGATEAQLLAVIEGRARDLPHPAWADVVRASEVVRLADRRDAIRLCATIERFDRESLWKMVWLSRPPAFCIPEGAHTRLIRGWVDGMAGADRRVFDALSFHLRRRSEHVSTRESGPRVMIILPASDLRAALDRRPPYHRLRVDDTRELAENLLATARCYGSGAPSLRIADDDCEEIRRIVRPLAGFRGISLADRLIVKTPTKSFFTTVHERGAGWPDEAFFAEHQCVFETLLPRTAPAKPWLARAYEARWGALPPSLK